MSQPKKGRPSTYSAELAKEICDTISSSSKGTKTLCKEHPHWPSQATLFTWLKNNEDFSEQYARGKQLQVEFLVDEILEIADDSSKDCMVNEHGVPVFSNEVDSDFSRFLQSLRKIESNRITEYTENILKTPKGHKGCQWMLEHVFWKYFSSSAPIIELNKRFEQIERG